MAKFKDEVVLQKLVSIIIPCYNESEVIEETVKQLLLFCAEITGLRIELIFVDDGSSDNTRELLRTFSFPDKRIKIIGFSRNFGHQIAVTAGIAASKGDAVVLLDADLQDPPALIHEMIQKWHSGFDVVYGARIERAGESVFKLVTARLFYRMLNKFSDVPIPLDTGDFRLMSRRAADALVSMPERARFIRGMVSWVGFRQIGIPYKRSPRFAGKSKYPLRKMLSFAIDGLLSFSTRPLRMSVAVGLISAGLALIGIVYALILRIFTNIWVEGWTAIMITSLFLGGVQLLSVGILGEYIGRIYNEVKGRPLYIIDESIGFSEEET